VPEEGIKRIKGGRGKSCFVKVSDLLKRRTVKGELYPFIVRISMSLRENKNPRKKNISLKIKGEKWAL